MIFAKYSYPLPNNGSGYSFSEQELVKLLDSVYERGYKYGVETTNAVTTITASYQKGPIVNFTLKDPNYMWNNNNEYDYKESIT